MSEFQSWLLKQLPTPLKQLVPLEADASFRRYYRIFLTDGSTLIGVNAPPATENSLAFVGIAQLFSKTGLCVPNILATDLSKGYLLISDLGNHHYSDHLTLLTADTLYKRALQNLLRLQTIRQNQGWYFPIFDAAMLTEELTRFDEWYLKKHLQLNLSAKENEILQKTFTLLVNSALEQPQVCVHRDYHSRNLMILPDEDEKVGILDFQDAVWGPITYDAVSLLRDRYFDWPPEKIQQWLTYYYLHAQNAGILSHEIFLEQFTQWFDWMGMQRHIKMVYIFARKWHRDHNKNYLPLIPRSLKFVKEVVKKYSEFGEFTTILNKCN